MSVTIELDLPDALVAEARAKGLFQSGSMTDLVANMFWLVPWLRK